MDDREGWREIVREIRAGDVTWLWWWSKLFVFRSSYSGYNCLLRIIIIIISYLKPYNCVQTNWIKIITWNQLIICIIHWLHLCRGVKKYLPPMNVLDMTLNHLKVRLQFWSFGEWSTSYCHYSQVHFDPE